MGVNDNLTKECDSFFMMLSSNVFKLDKKSTSSPITGLLHLRLNVEIFDPCNNLHLHVIRLVIENFISNFLLPLWLIMRNNTEC